VPLKRRREGSALPDIRRSEIPNLPRRFPLHGVPSRDDAAPDHSFLARGPRGRRPSSERRTVALKRGGTHLRFFASPAAVAEEPGISSVSEGWLPGRSNYRHSTDGDAGGQGRRGGAPGQAWERRKHVVAARMRKPFIGTQWVINPIRQSGSAAGTEMLRGRG